MGKEKKRKTTHKHRLLKIQTQKSIRNEFFYKKEQEKRKIKETKKKEKKKQPKKLNNFKN